MFPPDAGDARSLRVRRMTGLTLTHPRANEPSDADPAAPRPAPGKAAAGASSPDAASRQWADRLQAFRPRLVRALRRRLGNHADAEDVAQDALLRAYEQRRRYDPARPLAAWLYTIAFRLATDHQRRSARRPATVPADAHAAALAAPDAGPAQRAARHESAERLWRQAEDLLPPEQWTLLWLVYTEGLTPKQAAHAQGLKPGHARVLLHRARRTLADRLDPEEHP